MTTEDNKRRQIRESAEKYEFYDAEIRRVIASPSFTVPRLVVQANRLAASSDTSEEAIRDAKNAESLLKLIDGVMSR